MQFHFHHQLVSEYLSQVMDVDQVLEDDQPKIMTDHCILSTWAYDAKDIADYLDGHHWRCVIIWIYWSFLMPDGYHWSKTPLIFYNVSKLDNVVAVFD